jgi:hypothetical protein
LSADQPDRADPHRGTQGEPAHKHDGAGAIDGPAVEHSRARIDRIVFFNDAVFAIVITVLVRCSSPGRIRAGDYRRSAIPINSSHVEFLLGAA